MLKSTFSLDTWPSLYVSQVGFHDCPFGACSGFTHVAACKLARPPFRGLLSLGFESEGVDFLLGRDFHPLVKCTFHGALTLGAHAAQQGQAHLTIYEGVRDRVQGRFQGGLHSMGVKEGGIALAPVRLDFPGKEEALRKVEELRAKIIAGEIQIPKHLSELQGKDTARP